MSITLQSTEIINDLKQGIELVTGENYENLTEAVQSLKNGYGNSEVVPADFVGIKYSDFDEEGYPTIADARSLGKMTINNLGHLTVGLFYNVGQNNGMNIRLKEVYLPDGITGFSYTFQHCGALEKIYGNFDKVIDLGTSCFGNCGSLTELPYLPNVTKVAISAFVNCVGLTSVKFYKKLTNCSDKTFTGCTNLTDIYVPWAEGEVANAPWGAPNENLIIHYNTTYDENHNPITE